MTVTLSSRIRYFRQSRNRIPAILNRIHQPISGRGPAYGYISHDVFTPISKPGDAAAVVCGGYKPERLHITGGGYKGCPRARPFLYCVHTDRRRKARPLGRRGGVTAAGESRKKNNTERLLSNCVFLKPIMCSFFTVLFIPVCN